MGMGLGRQRTAHEILHNLTNCHIYSIITVHMKGSFIQPYTIAGIIGFVQYLSRAWTDMSYASHIEVIWLTYAMSIQSRERHGTNPFTPAIGMAGI